MTVEQYMKVSVFVDEDSIDQIGLLICELFNKTEDEVDNLTAKQFFAYSKKIEKTFTNIDRKKGFERFQTDATKITFGQFVEVMYFLKSPIDNLHFVMASLSEGGEHFARAERIRKSDIRCVLGEYKIFVESFNKLLESYSGLFEGEESDEEPHPFITQYGWIYSAKKIAEHEGIPLDKSFELPIYQALNDMAFLKSEQSYIKKMTA